MIVLCQRQRIESTGERKSGKGEEDQEPGMDTFGVEVGLRAWMALLTADVTFTLTATKRPSQASTLSHSHKLSGTSPRSGFALTP